MKKILSLFLYVVAAVAMTGDILLRALGLNRMQYALGLTADETNQTILDSLANITKGLGRVGDLEKSLGEQKSASEAFTKAFEAVQKELLELKKAQLSVRSARIRRGGEVSDECARFVGAVYLQAALRQEKLSEDLALRATKLVGDIIGKTALSSTDIPVPTQYVGEVAELVSEYGAARRLGTVFPLGNGITKLPRLKTSPAFGLIAGSGTVTEKGPQTDFVTFTAEKFGGLVRLPSELDEDSIVPLGQFLARYAAREMAKIEDVQFFISTGAGSGVNGSVKGLCVSVIDNSKVVQMASGKTKYSDTTLANLRAIRATVDAAAISRGKYAMHPSFEQHLSGLNTAGDKPYQANGANGATLDGFPIEWVDTMPAYSTTAAVSTVHVLFGDFTFQYLGVRSGMRFDTSREAGFATDEILVRALERFTIGLMATGAVSGLETAAS